MTGSTAPKPRSSFLRHLAAVLALVFALPSCITALLWSPQRHVTSAEIACDAAMACPAGAGPGEPIALRLTAESAAAIGVRASPAGGGVWIVLQPEDAAGVAAFLQQAHERRVANVTFVVTFRAPVAGEPRAADLRLVADFVDEPQPSGIEDARPSRQPAQGGEVYSRCSWQWASDPPVAGEALVPPAVMVENWPRGHLGTPAKVLLTPVTVACDVVLLPIEVLVTGMFWLAD